MGKYSNYRFSPFIATQKNLTMEIFSSKFIKFKRSKSLIPPLFHTKTNKIVTENRKVSRCEVPSSGVEF